MLISPSIVSFAITLDTNDSPLKHMLSSRWPIIWLFFYLPKQNRENTRSLAHSTPHNSPDQFSCTDSIGLLIYIMMLGARGVASGSFSATLYIFLSFFLLVVSFAFLFFSVFFMIWQFGVESHVVVILLYSHFIVRSVTFMLREIAYHDLYVRSLIHHGLRRRAWVRERAREKRRKTNL